MCAIVEPVCTRSFKIDAPFLIVSPCSIANFPTFIPYFATVLAPPLTASTMSEIIPLAFL